MKNIFNVEHKKDIVDLSILGLRISIGGLMLVHGLPKLAMLLSGGPVQFPGLFGLSPELSLILAVFAEVLCSILVIVGFGTRLAVIPLIITMLVAVFSIHAADPFANKELGLHYLLAYLILLATGSGYYSIDRILSLKTLKAEYSTRVSR